MVNGDRVTGQCHLGSFKFFFLFNTFWIPGKYDWIHEYLNGMDHRIQCGIFWRRKKQQHKIQLEMIGMQWETSWWLNNNNRRRLICYQHFVSGTPVARIPSVRFPKNSEPNEWKKGRKTRNYDDDVSMRRKRMRC